MASGSVTTSTVKEPSYSYKNENVMTYILSFMHRKFRLYLLAIKLMSFWSNANCIIERGNFENHHRNYSKRDAHVLVSDVLVVWTNR
jgi:hypothetical protein